MKSNRPSDLPALTSTRFIAAALVLLFHYQGLLWPSAGLRMIAGFGRAGVCFFFVLSGFILTYNYAGRFRGAVRRSEWIAFARARLARVYPMHLAAMVPATGVGLFLLAHAPQLTVEASGLGVPRGTVLASWVANVLLVQVYVPKLSFAQLWNGPSWSVACELFFYAAFPLFAARLLARLRGARSLAGAAVVFYAIECAMLAGALVLGRHSARHDTLVGLLLRMPMFRVWEFFIGCCAGELFRRGDWKPGRGARSGVILACSVVLAAMAPWHESAAAWYAAPTPVFALLVYCLAAGPTVFSPVLERRPVLLLGEASYSLYLLHLPPLLVLTYLAANGHPVSPWVVIGVMLALVGLSVACYRLIETPARRWLRGPGKVRESTQEMGPENPLMPVALT